MSLPVNYISLIGQLKERIRVARYKASLLLNKEVLSLYWEIGSVILEQQKTEGWGANVIGKLSVDLKTEFPDFKGLSVRNLKYMRDFAEAFPEFLQGIPSKIENEGNSILQQAVAKIQTTDNQVDTILQQAVAKLPWGHLTTLLDKVKNTEQRTFYILQTAENGWSRDIMLRNIESKLHERQGNAITNFPDTLPAIQSDLAQQTIKSPYNFDFIAFGDEMKERYLEKALIDHLKKFMLELGKGFSYVGNQKNLLVEGDDFFLDLLFFNIELNCYVIFELKIGDFKPEFAGKLNFYVNTVDAQLKKEHHQRTIGVLLCKTPNETVVKYSLKGIDSPIGVSEYDLAQSLPETIDANILSIEAVEEEMEREIEELKSPADKKFEALKEKLSQFKSKQLEQERSVEVVKSLVAGSFIPLYKAVIHKFSEFEDLFLKSGQSYYNNNSSLTSIEDVKIQWLEDEKVQIFHELNFTYSLDGFKPAGTNTFIVRKDIEIRFSQFFYEVFNGRGHDKEVFYRKLYTEQLNESEIAAIVDKLFGEVVDEMEDAIKNKS